LKSKISLLLSASLVFLTACQSKPIHGRSSVPTSQTQTSSKNNPEGSPLENKNYIFEESDSESQKDSPESMAGGVGLQNKNQNLKIGLILGPGAAKTYAHIGVLQELQRQKIPIHAVVGVEFAAPMAALFAWKGLANDVEWQMFKLKEESFSNTRLLSNNSLPIQMGDIKDFIKTVFYGLKAEDLKKPFACPSLNMNKNQFFMLSRGQLEQMLPYCWPYAPLFKPYSQSVSGVNDVKAMADYLRAQGSNHILLINVLGGNLYKKSSLPTDSQTFVTWSEIATLYSKPGPAVDSVVTLNLDPYSLNDISLNREIKNKGADLSIAPLKNFAERMGL
jgi:NTE family protein